MQNSWCDGVRVHWPGPHQLAALQLAIFSSLWTPFTRPRQIFSLGFLRVLTMYKVYTTLVYHYLRHVLSDVHQKVLNLAVGTLTLFLFFASLIMTLENMGDTTFFAFLSPEDSARWNMFTSFYFIMVSRVVCAPPWTR